MPISGVVNVTRTLGTGMRFGPQGKRCNSVFYQDDEHGNGRFESLACGTSVTSSAPPISHHQGRLGLPARSRQLTNGMCE